MHANSACSEGGTVHSTVPELRSAKHKQAAKQAQQQDSAAAYLPAERRLSVADSVDSHF